MLRRVIVLIFVFFAPEVVAAQQVADRVFATTFEVVEHTITVSPGSVILTPDSSVPLVAALRNAAGDLVNADLTWVSSNPEIVSVDGGVLDASDAIGSAVITVSAPGATQAKVLVAVAQPESGARLVNDSEVVSITPSAGDDPVAPGVVYDVTLAGKVDLKMDQAVIGTGDQPVAGRVVATQPDAGNTLVTLEVVPLYELFEALEISQQIDISQLPIEYPASITDNYLVVRDASGTVFLNPRPAARSTVIGTSAFFIFERDCETDVAGFEQALSVAPGENLHFSPSLSVDFVYTDQGFERLVVEGDLQAVFELQPRLRAQITGKVECKLQLGLIRLPVGGAFSLLFSGLVPLGAGFSLEATVTTTEEIGYDFTVSAGAQPRVGVACAPECDLTKELNFQQPQTAFRPVIPPTLASVDDTLKLAMKIFGFLYADLSFGNPFIETLQFESLEVKAGVRQELDLEQRDSQLGKPDYASSFALVLVANISLGNKIQDFLNALDISLIPTGFEVTNPMAQSAQGSLSITGPDGPGSAKAGETVTFSTSLSPPTYVGLDSIGEVNIYRMEQGKAGFVLTPAICSIITPDSNGVGSCTDTFSEEHVGSHTYVAVYYPQLFGITLPIPLEIAANSSTNFTVETAVEPEPKVSFGVEVCAEIYNDEDTLVEDCPDYDDVLPASDSAIASAGGASANVSAMASANQVSVTSSASSTNSNWAYGGACGRISAQYENIGSRSITIRPGLTALSDSPDAYYDVFLRACASTTAQKGCEGEVSGSLQYRGDSNEPGRISYKDGVFEDFTGGSITAALGTGNFVTIYFCAGSNTGPTSVAINSGGTASISLN